MITLNLKAENDCQQSIKDYLESNASVTLAEKINNGTKVEKDGKTLINKKTLTQFWNYASQKAQEMKTGYVANNTVFGWAIHYFEESDIIGTLYNEDGSEYKEPKPEYKPPVTPIAPPKPTPPKPAQTTLFDFLASAETPPKDEPAEEKIKEPVKELNDERKDEEIDDAPIEIDVDENGEIITQKTLDQYPVNSFYKKYLDIKKQYPHAVIAYRLGDFYEVLGDIAIIIARELELTLTSREVGLPERIAMIGFPYYSAEPYFNKIRASHKLVAVDQDDIKILEMRSLEDELSQTVPIETPIDETPIPREDNDEDLEDLRAHMSHIDRDAMCILLELFDYELDVQ